jgi:hypothetical protein
MLRRTVPLLYIILSSKIDGRSVRAGANDDLPFHLWYVLPGCVPLDDSGMYTGDD